MSNVETVLFDLDGCLTDSGPAIVECLNFTLEKMGRERRSSSALHRYIGPPLRENMLDLFGEGGADEGVSLFRHAFLDLGYGLRYTVTYDGIPEMLRQLQNAGFKLYIATSKGEDSAKLVLDGLGLLSFFDGVHGGGSGGIDKGELISFVLQKNNLRKDSTIMVGDREHDVIGAKKNAIRSIGVLWGYGSREELQAAGADTLLTTPSAMFDCIQCDKAALRAVGSTFDGQKHLLNKTCLIPLQ